VSVLVVICRPEGMVLLLHWSIALGNPLNVLSKAKRSTKEENLSGWPRSGH